MEKSKQSESVPLADKSVPPASIPGLDVVRPYFEYAVPFATVGSLLIGGLTYLSERRQERRLEAIERKLDAINQTLIQINARLDDILRQIITRIEDVQLRNVTGGVMAIEEQIRELPLVNNDAFLANILSESARLKNIIQVTLDSADISVEMRSSYASLLGLLIPLRITAFGASSSSVDSIFKAVEDESLDFELRAQSHLDALVGLERSAMIASEVYWSFPREGSIQTDGRTRMAWYIQSMTTLADFESDDMFEFPHVYAPWPDERRYVRASNTFGNPDQQMRDAYLRMAQDDRVKEIDTFIWQWKRDVSHGDRNWSDVHVQNRKARFELSDSLGKPKREILFPSEPRGIPRIITVP